VTNADVGRNVDPKKLLEDPAAKRLPSGELMIPDAPTPPTTP